MDFDFDFGLVTILYVCLELPEVHGNRATIDLLNVVKAKDPGFSIIWRDRLLTKGPNFHEMIEAYRKWCAMDDPWWDTGSETTFKGQSYDGSDRPNQRGRQLSRSRGRGRRFRPSGHRS